MGPSVLQKSSKAMGNMASKDTWPEWHRQGKV